MRKTDASLLKRAKWYILGFVLFFAPFALWPRFGQWILGIRDIADIHEMCLRMPVGNLLTGNVALHGVLSVSFISFIILVLAAFLLGPIFCGRLCAAGAIPEYLSRIVPDKWKIDWRKVTNPTPIRYGFFAGFLVSPLIASALTCGFCHFAFVQRCTYGGLGVLGSTTILTAILWLVLFGLFNQGGRGFCSYMCPMGALQNLLHSIGARLGFTYKLKHDQNKCSTCGTCVKACPMGALEQEQDGQLTYNIHNCLTCRHCENLCPSGAISYGRGKSGWYRREVKK